jgi:hypothetical protein
MYNLLGFVSSYGVEDVNRKIATTTPLDLTDILQKALRAVEHVQAFLNRPENFHCQDDALLAKARWDFSVYLRFLAAKLPSAILNAGADTMHIREFCNIFSVIFDHGGEVEHGGTRKRSRFS